MPKDYHVNHFIPKGIFKNEHPEYFIRLMLLPRHNNCSFCVTVYIDTTESGRLKK